MEQLAVLGGEAEAHRHGDGQTRRHARRSVSTDFQLYQPGASALGGIAPRASHRVDRQMAFGATFAGLTRGELLEETSGEKTGKSSGRIGKRGAVQQEVQHPIGVQEDASHRYFSTR